MRLHGDVSDEEEADAAMDRELLSSSSPNGAAAAADAVAAPRLVVGYALTKKKVKSFLQPKLLLLARKNGISFISIDVTRPLSEQGPFDIILHKKTSKEWQQILEVIFVRRFSVPDVNTYDLLNNVGIYRLPRVSCAAASADHADLDPRIAELPPRPLLEKLSRELRGRLGLRLFNIDMIRELGANDRYYIIDINYFPGYGKMPGYEHIFTDFLQSLGQNKYKRCLSGG